MSDSVSRETPLAPEVAAGVFSHSLDRATAYAELLAGPGTDRGLMGPREVPRLWERHLLNCAVLTDLVEEGATVCDIGSGAGLPGLVMAIRRPDLQITLVEPLLRRTTFLAEAVEVLGLVNVAVVRGRADALHGIQTFDVVTSRAVAPLGRLLGWSLPLVRRGGVVLAMKGESAAEEVEAVADDLAVLGGGEPEIVVLGENSLLFPTTVVRVPATADPQLGLGHAKTPAKRGASRQRNKRR
jgi:16S rRNA (guanine527-N7)-methyltransferase